MTRGVVTLGNGLQAALLLARGRPEGMALLAAPPDQEMAQAARSFWALTLCLPAFLCLHLLDWAQIGMPAQPAISLAYDFAGYVIGWCAFALVSHRLAGKLGRAAAWPRFIAIWNWCNVIQYLMLVAAALPGLLGLPDLVGQAVWLFAMGWALWLEWYATRLALDIPGPPAAALVALDVALGLLMVALTAQT
jgi:hypothetical protein